MCLPQLVAFDMHVCEGNVRGGSGGLSKPVAAVGRSRCLACQLGGTAQPPAQGLDKGEVPQAVSLREHAIRSGGSGGGGTKGDSRLVETARPEFRYSAAGKDLGANLGMLGDRPFGDLLDQCLRGGGCGCRGIEIGSPAGNGQPDQRGGQPSRNLVVSRKPLEDAFRGV